MTIILAIPANHGVVLASDGQITYADGIRATGKKIFQLNKKCLWAASGRDALIQRIQEKLSPYREGEDSLARLRDNLSQVIKRCVIELFQLDEQPPEDSFIFVEYTESGPKILHIAVTGTPEWVTTGAFAIGIGRMFAHALLQKYTYIIPDKIDVERASLLAYKVIEEAIAVGAFGLGHPIDIWQVSQEGIKNLNTYEISRLEDLSLVLRGIEINSFLKVSENETN